jgi:DNA-binding transcriptional regulator YiaG
MNDNVILLVEARRAAEDGRARALREAAGLSQGEVARAASVSPATVSRWEGRLRKPSGDAAIRWARILRLISGETKAA